MVRSEEGVEADIECDRVGRRSDSVGEAGAAAANEGLLPRPNPARTPR